MQRSQMKMEIETRDVVCFFCSAKLNKHKNQATFYTKAPNLCSVWKPEMHLPKYERPPRLNYSALRGLDANPSRRLCLKSVDWDGRLQNLTGWTLGV